MRVVDVISSVETTGTEIQRVAAEKIQSILPTSRMEPMSSRVGAILVLLLLKEKGKDPVPAHQVVKRDRKSVV